MIEFLFVFGIFVVAIVGFAASLHFSQYKKRNSGCCGGGHCDTKDGKDGAVHSCYSEKLNYIDNKVIANTNNR